MTEAPSVWLGVELAPRTALQIFRLRIESSSWLAFVRRADDAKFFHPAAERVRVQVQDSRGAARTVDDPT
jgi:hypothetical protein